MIRYVDISKSLKEDGYKFAFWDTINSEFIELSNEQAWETWAEFESAARTNNYKIDIERFKRLYQGSLDTGNGGNINE